MKFFSPDRLARKSANHPWLTLGIWLLVIVSAVGAASQLKFTPGFDVRGSDSAKADDILENKILGKSPATETIVVQSQTQTVDDAGYQAFVNGLVAQVRGLDKTVGGVTSYYELGDESLVSKDRRTTILPVALTSTVVEAPDEVGPLLDLLKARGKCCLVCSFARALPGLL